MKFSPALPWHKNYVARFGGMTEAQQNSIQLALYESMRANADEINTAVANLCGAWSDERRPNITDIGNAITKLRNSAQGISTPSLVIYYVNGVRYQTTMHALKQLLNRRPDPDEAWEIICTPMDSNQCRELLLYCENHAINYRRFIPPDPVNVRLVVDAMDERRRIERGGEQVRQRNSEARQQVYLEERGLA